MCNCWQTATVLKIVRGCNVLAVIEVVITWMWGVSLMFRSLYILSKSPWHLLNGGWIILRAGQGALKNITTSCPMTESNQDSSAVRPVAQSLYRMRCHGCKTLGQWAVLRACARHLRTSGYLHIICVQICESYLHQIGGIRSLYITVNWDIKT
jgi:hypothetical protein